MQHLVELDAWWMRRLEWFDDGLDERRAARLPGCPQCFGERAANLFRFLAAEAHCSARLGELHEVDRMQLAPVASPAVNPPSTVRRSPASSAPVSSPRSRSIRSTSALASLWPKMTQWSSPRSQLEEVDAALEIGARVPEIGDVVAGRDVFAANAEFDAGRLGAHGLSVHTRSGEDAGARHRSYRLRNWQ